MKKWYTSKTLWVNIIALAALAFQGAKGWVIGPEYQIMLLGVINMILRAVTKSEIVWKKDA